jgi:unsaturated rhamnogalacturonyl hydrolase
MIKQVCFITAGMKANNKKWADPVTGRSPNFWGRAMGWFGMALVDVLDFFPENHPQRKNLLAILTRYVNAVAKWQDGKTGLWWDVLNFPGKEKNYLEASASSMFVYTIAKAARKSYIPASKFSIASKGYNGLLSQFIKVENGQTNLHGTVKVSGLGGNPYRDGSYTYYVGEPVIVNDPKGMGAFILAANEMELGLKQSVGKGKTVLLDNYFNNEWKKDITGREIPYHYTWNDKSNSGFSMLGNVFDQYGVKKAELKAAPLKENLKNANIYIIVDPDTEKETANPHYVQKKDVAAIADWVKDGGVLVLMANDSGNCEFQHLNQVAEKFGIHFNEDRKNLVQGNNFEQGMIFIPPNDPIMPGVPWIYVKELSSLSLKPPAQAVLTSGNINYIAVSRYGKGTVFAIGDPWLYNEYVDGRKLPPEYENFKAATGLVNWLIGKTKK